MKLLLSAVTPQVSRLQNFWGKYITAIIKHEDFSMIYCAGHVKDRPHTYEIVSEYQAISFLGVLLPLLFLEP
jgi:hypothetical protein